MSQPDLNALPRSDRSLLRATQIIVPPLDREDWLRTWYAELWHRRHHARREHASLTLGLTRDALWLRTESWRHTYTGTVSLCLAFLSALCAFATLLALVLTGSWHTATLYLGARFVQFLIAAPFVLLVAFAISPSRYTEQTHAGKVRFWLKRQSFLAAKSALLLLLSFLFSADLFHAPHAAYPLTADLLQIFTFVIIALLGLRWSFLDQQQRCKQCLRSLATPVRIGRPSHNLLEWNGTELLCRDGHGSLNVPEMETSWCQSSQWTFQSQ